MGFFDRFFGKKKEEPPRTPAPAYVPPEPPPLPTAGTPARSAPTDTATESPLERALEQQPLTTPVESSPAAAMIQEALATDDAQRETAARPLNIPVEEPDFSIPVPADRARDAAELVEVEEVALGVGTRLEAASHGKSLEIGDGKADLDEADFDLPTAQVDYGGVAEPSVADEAATHEAVFGLGDEDDLEGFDDAFENILARGADDDLDEDATPAVTTDQTEIRTLFSEIAANYIRPVKAFMIELRSGAARKEWLEMCQPAISSLGKSALGMGMEDVSDAVHDFEGLLSEARASREGTVGGELRERILQSYQSLTDMLPATFVIDDSTLQSEGMIVNSLLKQIPEVGKVTIDKLYRAGLITIESFLVGAKEDLAVATGLPIWLAEKIVDKFKSYQQQLESGTVQTGKDGLLARLEQLTRDLQDAHEAYEAATAEESSNPSAAEDRRFYRQARQETQLQINVLLAELGAVELANEIQRLSFEKRIERLRRYVVDVRRS